MGVRLCRGRRHSYHHGRPLCEQIWAVLVIYSSNRAPPDMVSGIIDRDGVSQLPWLSLQRVVRDIGSVIDSHVVFYFCPSRYGHSAARANFGVFCHCPSRVAKRGEAKRSFPADAGTLLLLLFESVFCFCPSRVTDHSEAKRRVLADIGKDPLFLMRGTRIT